MKYFVVLLITLVSIPASAEDAEELYLQRQSAMRARAEATSVADIKNGTETESKPVGDPLFRYRDEPRDILDGTLWAYGKPGRPTALQKIEVYRNQSRYFFCLASFSEDTASVKWGDGQTWTSSKPGIEFKDVSGAPKPATSPLRRLRQMKQLAARFDATLFNQVTNQETKMRPLPRPVYRYANAEQGIDDAAIFSFATYGTNPDLLLAIELQNVDGELTWKYGLARMTLCKVVVTLDDQEVWQVPFVRPRGPDIPSKFPTWLFLYERP